MRPSVFAASASLAAAIQFVTAPGLAVMPLTGPGSPAGSWPLTLAVVGGLSLPVAERCPGRP